MAMKPVDRNIKVVFGPAIDDADFKTREEVIPFDAAGMEIDVIVEAADGTVTHTAVVPTDTGGDYDWTAADQGYYELELPASSGLSFNNDTLGILTVVVYVLQPFHSPQTVSGFPPVVSQTVPVQPHLPVPKQQLPEQSHASLLPASASLL